MSTNVIIADTPQDSQSFSNPLIALDGLELPPMPPQVRRFVAFLIHHRGRIVFHKKMYAHLWPYAQHFERYKLTQEARRARDYLGDDDHTLIVNVRDKGYKWGGPLPAKSEAQ